MQAALEAEIAEALAAKKANAPRGGFGYRSGYYSRALITRVGAFGGFGFLRIGLDGFRQSCFERYQRSEKALVGTLAEMYVQGVSTRK